MEKEPEGLLDKMISHYTEDWDLHHADENPQERGSKMTPMSQAEKARRTARINMALFCVLKKS